jgi:hypothetical protein
LVLTEEARQGRLVERPRGHGHLDLVDLALVADVGGADETRLLGGDTVGAELGRPALFKVAEVVQDSRRVEGARENVDGLVDVEQVRRGGAERGAVLRGRNSGRGNPG